MIRVRGSPAAASNGSRSTTAIASNTTIAIFIAVRLSLTRVTAKKIASAAGG